MKGFENGCKAVKIKNEIFCALVFIKIVFIIKSKRCFLLYILFEMSKIKKIEKQLKINNNSMKGNYIS